MEPADPAASVLPRADRDLQPGQKVGEYVIEAKAGEGGFGTVYRASHPLIGKIAAIKVLNRQYSSDPEMVSRFVAEARAVNQIRHRNIIDIFAFGALEDGRHYYVMEFLEGAPLDEHLDQGGALPLAEAIPILRAVARALDAAHAKGIAHRDLKPENIFLAHESDGAVFPKLLDFGIAKLLGSTAGGAMHKTRTGAPIGTPYYMSPEQCRGRDVDHRTDIYAFGVVAYKLLTGVVPFDGDDYMDILLKQIGEEPIPPSTLNAALSPAIDEAIAWMMKKDPAARPPNLITAMRALEEAAVAAGVAVATDSPTGLHATQTSRVAAQRTPSAITPLPRGARSSDLGNAATMDAGKLSDAIVAVSAATPGVGAVGAVSQAGTSPGVASDGAPRSSRVLIAALAGALVVGIAVFVAIRATRGGDDGEARATGGAAATAVATSGDAPGTAGATGDDPGTAAATAAGTGAATGAGTGAATGAGTGAATAVVEPRLVKVTIAGVPDGTEVYGPGGTMFGVAPVIQLPRGDEDVVLTLRAEGYVAAAHTVRPSDDVQLEVVLERKPSGGKGGKGGKSGGTGKGTGKGTAGGSGTGTGTGRNSLEDPFAKGS